MKASLFLLTGITAVSALFGWWPIFALCGVTWLGIGLFFGAKGLVAAVSGGCGLTCAVFGWLGRLINRFRNRERSRWYKARKARDLFTEEITIINDMPLGPEEKMGGRSKAMQKFVDRLDEGLWK